MIKEPSAVPSARAAEPTSERSAFPETVKEQVTTSAVSLSPSEVFLKKSLPLHPETRMTDPAIRTESVSEKSSASPATQSPPENNDSGLKSIPAPGIALIAGSLMLAGMPRNVSKTTDFSERSFIFQ